MINIGNNKIKILGRSLINLYTLQYKHNNTIKIIGTSLVKLHKINKWQKVLLEWIQDHNTKCLIPVECCCTIRIDIKEWLGH